MLKSLAYSAIPELLESNTLYSTKNYEQFGFLDFNRKIIINKKLLRSIEKYGWLVPIICAQNTDVLGNKTIWIIDGQHRFEMFRAIGAEIQFIIRDFKQCKTKDDYIKVIAELNLTGTKWKPSDFMNAWTQRGAYGYQQLESYYHSCNARIPHNVLATIFSDSSNRNTVSTTLREGEFIIKESALNQRIFNLCSILANKYDMSSRNIEAINKLMKEFSKINPQKISDVYDTFIDEIRSLGEMTPIYNFLKKLLKLN